MPKFRLLLSLILFLILFLTPTFAEENPSVSVGRAFLLSAHQPDQIAIVDASGKTLWSIGAEEGVQHPQDAAATEDGAVFFSVTHGAKMVRVKDKTLLWNYAAPEGTENPVAQLLGPDLFLVGNEGPCKLLEINASGEIQRQIQVADPPFQGSHGQFRFCRKTKDGTYLFPMINAGILREYDASGNQLRQFPVSAAPVGAIRLPDGRTLTGAGSAVEEFDAEGNLVWRFDCAADGGLKPALVTAVSRLKNGNTLVGYYSADPEIPDIIEITPDKKIVFQFALPETNLVAALELLDPDFKPSKEILCR